jgi:hypothetical protein
MTNLDREQLKRDCADALSMVSQNKGVDGLDAVAASIAELGPEYRAHGTLMQASVAERKDMTIMWHLLHVIEKLEKGVE